MIIKKKGELTTQQIVMFIILIVSFGILIYFLSQLGFNKQNNKEICHNSVITRGNQMIPTESVPLNCKRAYICITEDGTCEAMTKPNKEKVKSQEDVYAILSEELANCWWMFGEGKVNYVGEDLTENLYCSMCSQIAFDDSMKKIFPEEIIQKEELANYLVTHNVSGMDKSYSEYLYGRNNVFFEGDFGTMNINKQYYVLTGITSDISTLGWIGVGFGVGAAVTVGVLASPLTGGASVTLIPVLIGSTVGATIGAAVPQKYLATTVKGESGNEYVVPAIIEVNSNEFKSLHCDEVATAA